MPIILSRPWIYALPTFVVMVAASVLWAQPILEHSWSSTMILASAGKEAKPLGALWVVVHMR